MLKGCLRFRIIQLPQTYLRLSMVTRYNQFIKFYLERPHEILIQVIMLPHQFKCDSLVHQLSQALLRIVIVLE